MAKKLLNMLTRNIVYKILALLLACVLWVIVYNTNDPNVTQTYTASVTVTNESTITDMNKCYEILDGTNIVSFTVTGPRSYLDKLEDTNFTAVADMNRMVTDDENETATVPISISSNRYSSYITFGATRYLKISLEDLQSKKFTITAVASGEVAEGYALGAVSVSAPTILNVSGPASIVSTIESVVAVIDVDSMTVSMTDNVVPILYDEDGKKVDTTRLTLSNETVTVSATILNQKTVSLSFGVEGTPADGYEITGITYSPDKISVKGTSAVLNELASVEIPSSVLNVDGATENIETTIDITEYLPDGVELVDTSQCTITIEVIVEGLVTKSITLNTSELVTEGLSDDLEVSFPQSKVTIQVSGLQAAIDELTEDMINGAIDLTGYTTGTFSVPINIQLDESVYQIQNASTYVTITSKETPDEGGDAQEGSSEDSEDSEAPEADSGEDGGTDSENEA